MVTYCRPTRITSRLMLQKHGVWTRHGVAAVGLQVSYPIPTVLVRPLNNLTCYMSTKPAISVSTTNTIGCTSTSTKDTQFVQIENQAPLKIIPNDSYDLDQQHEPWKGYFDTQLRIAMSTRQKDTVIKLYHEYLQQHVDPSPLYPLQTQLYSLSHRNPQLLLLSVDVYESLIYTLTPLDLHGAILAFHLYQKASSLPVVAIVDNDDTKKKRNDKSIIYDRYPTINTLDLIKRILRSLETVSPNRSTFFPFYNAYFQMDHHKRDGWKKNTSTTTSSISTTPRKLYALEMVMAVQTIQNYILQLLQQQQQHDGHGNEEMSYSSPLNQQQQTRNPSIHHPRVQPQEILDLIPRLIYALLAQKYSHTLLIDMTLDLWRLYKESIHTNRNNIPMKATGSRSTMSNIQEDEDEQEDTPSSTFSFNTLWCENILRCSTYRRQEWFPFGDVLLFVLSNGGKPSPRVVLHVIHNEFPFDNVRLLEKIFQGLIRLQQTKESWQLDYRLDIGTLQHISIMAARRGSSNLIFLIWDYMELFDYGPVSEAMYEDTIVALVESRWQDSLFLQVLYEMEKKRGFVPQRPLIRSISRSIRPIIGRIQNILRFIQKRAIHKKDPWKKEYPVVQDVEEEMTPGEGVTTAMLNCVLSAYAEWGLVDKVLDVFDEFNKLECYPNDDTFAFLMEAVAINITTAIETKTNAENKDDTWTPWISSQLDSVEVIIHTMYQMKCSWTHPMVYNYIRILCAIGESNKALIFLEDINTQETSTCTNISLDTFTLLATSFALHDNRHGVNMTKELSQRHGHSFPSYTSERIERLLK